MHNSRLVSRAAVLPWAFSDQDPDMGFMYGGIHNSAGSYPFSLSQIEYDWLADPYIYTSSEKKSTQEVECVTITPER